MQIYYAHVVGRAHAYKAEVKKRRYVAIESAARMDARFWLAAACTWGECFKAYTAIMRFFSLQLW